MIMDMRSPPKPTFRKSLLGLRKTVQRQRRRIGRMVLSAAVLSALAATGCGTRFERELKILEPMTLADRQELHTKNRQNLRKLKDLKRTQLRIEQREAMWRSWIKENEELNMMGDELKSNLRKFKSWMNQAKSMESRMEKRGISDTEYDVLAIRLDILMDDLERASSKIQDKAALMQDMMISWRQRHPSSKPQ